MLSPLCPHFLAISWELLRATKNSASTTSGVALVVPLLVGLSASPQVKKKGDLFCGQWWCHDDKPVQFLFFSIFFLGNRSRHCKEGRGGRGGRGGVRKNTEIATPTNSGFFLLLFPPPPPKTAKQKLGFVWENKKSVLWRHKQLHEHEQNLCIDLHAEGRIFSSCLYLYLWKKNGKGFCNYDVDLHFMFIERKKSQIGFSRWSVSSAMIPSCFSMCSPTFAFIFIFILSLLFPLHPTPSQRVQVQINRTGKESNKKEEEKRRLVLPEPKLHTLYFVWKVHILQLATTSRPDQTAVRANLLTFVPS